MAYRMVYLRIRSDGYNPGWASDADRAAFKEESRRLFQELGWTLHAGCNGVCDTVTMGEGDWGYKFATWRRSLDGAGLNHGNYYHNDYDGAKLDFACQSGLVRESRQFTDEQLTELYRCIHETLNRGYPITREREDILRTVAERIEDSVDDLDDRVMRSNEKELAAAERRPEFDVEQPGSIEIYGQDLTPAKQREILQAFGESGNFACWWLPPPNPR